MANIKVAVAMSGGVDSSVAALLLKRAGYQVIGITMRLWAPTDGINQPDISDTAADDAGRVARFLGIPHQVLDLREYFDTHVMQYFCREYLQGRTPNPCVECNRHLKFGSLLDKAREMGAEYLATGHYARIDNAAGQFRLLKAKDEKKDQSYVLYTLTQQQLSHILLPLGDYNKEAIREVAREAGLPAAEKSESQDICFVPDGEYVRFVEGRTEKVNTRGPFCYRDGRHLGDHQGIHNYTIGQRKGLGLALGHPVFVTGIDPDSRTVWIGEDQDLRKRSLQAVCANYISGTPFQEPVRVTAKIRYSAKPAGAVVSSLDDSRLQVVFDEPQRAITPGQSVVLYSGQEVLGGAIINEIID